MGGILIAFAAIATALTIYVFGYWSAWDKHREINQKLHTEINNHLREIVTQQQRIDFLEAENDSLRKACRAAEARVIACTGLVNRAGQIIDLPSNNPKEKKNV